MALKSQRLNAKRTGQRIALILTVCLITAIALTIIGTKAARRSGSPQERPSARQQREPQADAAARTSLQELRANGGPEVEAHASLQTQKYSFVRAKNNGVLAVDDTSATAEARALAFLSLHGGLVGLNDNERQMAARQVQAKGTRSAAAAGGNGSQLGLLRVVDDGETGATHVRLTQSYAGLPVFGAQLIVHMDKRGITGINGNFVPDIHVRVTPKLDPQQAGVLAIAGLQKKIGKVSLSVGRAELDIYRTGLLEGFYGENVLAYGVEIRGEGKLREQIWVNARTGSILNQISLTPDALYRIAYTPQYDPANPDMFVVRKEGDPPISPPQAPPSAIDNLYDFTGQTYNFYASAFGRDSYDGLGKTMRTVLLANNQCPNAYWNGSTTNYCPGFDEDDVVSHEWSHAYTEYTHGLIYSYQSGALNESYSDIFGETVDLLNGVDGSGGSDNVNHAEYSEVNGNIAKTGGGERFQLGEDFQGLNQPAAGILRDMYTPTAFGNADKTSSPNYSCGSGDNGGVHNNSGVPNHAYALVVDGGTFNGQSNTGIGLTKAAAIYFRAESVYQHPTTNFADHQVAIETSCSDLVGQTIYVLSTNNTTHTPSVEVITPQDCAEVHKAMLAVEMSAPVTQCNFPPLLNPDTPATCSGSSTVFNEDWQSGFPHAWTLSSTGVNAEWNAAAINHNWVANSSLPGGRPGTAAFAFDDPSDGACAAGDDQSGHFSITSPTITVPAGANDLRLSFDHYVETEAGFDGGNLLISINGGAFALVPPGNYVFNGPNAPLNPAVATDGSNNTNPKAGEDAWTGSNISTGSGSWGTTIIDLSSLTNPGDTIKLQYDFGKDGCGGGTGWFVDNVRVFSCPQLDAPVLSLGADYENPDTNGSYTLNWTSIAGTGPYVVQQSTSSCLPLLADDAESGLGQWTSSTSGTGAVDWTTSTAKPQHTGTAFFARGVEGATSADSMLTFNQTVTIPQTGQTFLNFSDWDDNEGDDNVYVEVSEDGTNWVQIYSHNRSESGTGALSFANEALFPRHVTLANFGGKTIHLRFRLALGIDDRPASTPFGWYVDDIALVNDSWNDVNSNAGTSLLVSGQTNGTRCYRVRTTYTFGSETAPGPFSNAVTAVVNTGAPSPSPTPNACVPPGIQVVSDPEGDEFGHVGVGTDPNQQQDILAVSIAEQYEAGGAGTLVFTMKVPAIDPANLPNNASWNMFFDGTHADNTTTTYFVSADMNSLANPTGISYNYGFYDTTTGFNTTVGTADSGSISAANKTLTISLRMDKVTKPIPGTGQQTLGGAQVDLSAGKHLTNVNGVTSILIGVGGNGGNQTIDTTSNQTYTMAGAAACAQPSPSPSASPTPTPDTTSCALPGKPVLIDPGNDATDTAASHEIESLSMAEPFVGNNTRKLVFTLKMKNLTTLTPNTAWPVFFSTPSASYYVDMQTDAGNAVTFKYGTGPSNGRVAAGDLDAESNYDAATGKITLYISNSKLGGIARGDQITNIYVRVTLDATAAFLYPDSAPSTNTVGSTASYTLVGNDFCGGNVAPTANLFGAPHSGPAPMVVAFDASGSTDPDDGIASYTFDFGDGTTPFTQAGPQLSHRYDNAGVFIASLQVTDAGGQSSYNSTTAIISVGSNVAPPQYQIYQAPNGVGTDSGEPSLGTNWQTGRALFIAGLQTLRISFDDCFSPARALWEDISAPNTSKRTLDPILFTDHMRAPGDTTPNRTIVSQLSGTTSLSSYTDDDGGLWVPNQGGSGDSGVDHQTVGAGPFHAPIPGNPTYPNAVYYCSQDLADTAFCAMSLDGGLTYGSSVPIYTVAQGGCGGLHGHVKVAPNGTVYVPNKSCNGMASVVRSTDNGITWTVKSVPNSGTTGFLVDPSLGIGSDGTVYLGYQNTNGHAHVAVSTDEGDSWIQDIDVASLAGLQNTTFPEVVAGDGNRAAFAFLGTSTGGNYTLESFTGVWYLYVATTFDRGQSWTVVNATPNDPVQRGSICNLGTTSCSKPPLGSRTKSDRNLLDFMDATIDAQGRVLVAYPDGCVTNVCIQGGDVDGNGTINNNDNDFAAKATIARQSAGKRLVAAFDPPDPSAPGMPALTAVRDTAVHLSWTEPANGGLPITSYHVYRRADGAAQRTQIAGTNSTTFSYDDLTADPSTTYHYLVTAVNAVGESQACANAEVVPLLSGDHCHLPGFLLMTDPKGENLSAADGSLDILAAYVAEPYEAGQPDKLVWTMQLADLNTIVPNRQWYIIWTPAGPGLRKYVAAKSDATGTLSYEYGEVGSSSVGDPNINTPMPQGPADGGSVDRANGTFTITIANSKVGSPIAGSTLLTISPRTFAGTGNQNVISTSADDLTTNTPSYTLVGNNFCRPQTAPTAALSAAVHGTNPPTLEGAAPLMVDFDASGSSDPDAGDTPLTYTFDFGDGSNVVTQTSPTTTHTYNDPATYRATLTAKDARGQTSLNIADIFITVGNISITGEVAYGSDNARKVPDVTLTLTGNNNFPSRTAISNATGNFVLANLPSGNDYTLTPSKPPTVNGLESFDASFVARWVAGLDPAPGTNQRIAADADGDGILTSFDAALIARKVAGLSDTGIVGTWKFNPATRSYSPLTASQASQNFDAILVGDTSGSWSGSAPAGGAGGNAAALAGGAKQGNGAAQTSPTNTPGASQGSTSEASAVRAKTAPQSPTVTIPVNLAHVAGAMNTDVNVPITVTDLTGQGVKAYDLQVTYNPAIVQPASPDLFDKTGTLSSGMLITPNANNSGHLIISAFQATDLSGAGVLLYVRFHVVGSPGQSTPLTFEDYTDPNPTFHPGFRFNSGTPQAGTTNGSLTVSGPTAAHSIISGRIVTGAGNSVGGVVLTLSGSSGARKAISNSQGDYRFTDVETGGFYTVTPALANYRFSPADRSFSLVGDKTDAAFTASSDATQTANAIDTAEYFVRQQYLDFLGREPDQGGFEYWSGQINQCQGDAACVNSRRIGVSAAFFIEQEFQQTGTFIYDLYKGALGRRPAFAEYSADRQQVVGGANLDAKKSTLAESFVQRTEFTSKYQANTTAESFVDALIQNALQSLGVDLSAQRDRYLNAYNGGGNMNQSRGLVVRVLADEASLKQAEYNRAFVLAQYFGYLRRDPEDSGYNFWLNVLDSQPSNFRAMVCAFITSDEYQNRFGAVHTHSNAECSGSP